MKICACCGKEIDGLYYKCLDNYLQVKYFDSDECNIFCSNSCFCEALSLETFFVEDDEVQEDE